MGPCWYHFARGSSLWVVIIDWISGVDQKEVSLIPQNLNIIEAKTKSPRFFVSRET